MRQVQEGQLSQRKQKGATLLGILFICAILVFVAIILTKLFPSYQEYYSVKTTLRSMKQEPLSDMTKNEIADSFDRRANTGYITSVKGSDLTLDKNAAGDVVLVAEYQVVKPLFGNLSALMDFKASSD